MSDDRNERVAAIRSTLATDDARRAIAQRIDEEISALALELRATYPDRAASIARALNESRACVGDIMRHVGLVAEVQS